MQRVKQLLKVLPAILLFASFAVAPAQAQAPAKQKKQKVVVHLTRFSDDLHAVKMAVHLAARLQARGAEVTMLLDLEGVRLADTRQPIDLIWGKGDPISSELEEFVKAGGKMMLCPHCAEHNGITPATLRPGASIGPIGELILAADKILDY